jgi:hypothetical protein
MITDELQRMIDEYLRALGDDGKFRTTVAKEGMVRTEKEGEVQQQQQQQQHKIYNESISAGKVLEIESLQKYILNIEDDNNDDKLKLMIEDRINRFNFEFVRPSKDVHSDDILYGQGMKGTMAKGPELRTEIVPSRSHEEKEASAIKIRVVRGRNQPGLCTSYFFLFTEDYDTLRRFKR